MCFDIVDCLVVLIYSGGMITDADIKKMAKVFATKDDLKQLRKGIVSDVAEYIADTIVPLFDKHDRRITSVESRLGIRAAD